MSSEQERIIGRIKKLMQHAQGEGHHSEGEVENALKLARKLMKEYGVSEDQVILTDEGRTNFSDTIVQQEAWGKRGMMEWQEQLSWVPAHICDVRPLINGVTTAPGGYRSRNPHFKQTVLFVGSPRDCAVAIALYKELLTTVRFMSRRFSANSSRQRSYANGFVNRLILRAKEMKSTPGDSTGNAIVLAKDKIIDEWIKAKFVFSDEERKSRDTRRHDWGAYSAGARDANNVSLDTNGIGESNGSDPRQLPS